MHKRFLTIFCLFIAAIALGSCGDDSATEATPTESTLAEDTVEQPDLDSSETPAEEAPIDVPGEEVDAPSTGACAEAFTAAEYEQVFGVAVRVGAGNKICNTTFASDSVGTFSIFSGDEADLAMDTLLPEFVADAPADGVVLADDRGFIDGYSAVVLGDSGRVFRIDIPDNVEVADLPAAMQAVVDILLTR